jgi:hypothetical protein
MSAAKLIVSEEKRGRGRVAAEFFILSNIAMAIGFGLNVAMGGPEHKSIAEYAQSLAPTLSYVFVAIAFFFMASCMFFLWYSKKAGHPDENEEPEAAQEESDDDDAPSGADGQGD